jgi:AcrR family transcriptional regulator
VAERNGPRGPYRKGLERRREIIAAAAELFAESGYTHSSMRELARRMNLTQPGVLHHFADKEELLVEVLGLRDSSVADYLSDLRVTDVASRSREVARHSAEHEGLTSLFIILSAEAIYRDHPAHSYFAEHYRSAQEQTLPASEPSGDVPVEVSPELIAALGIAVQDGLQLQRRYRDDLDVVAAVDAFWRLVAAARRTWTQQPPQGSEGRPAAGSD